MNNDVTVWQDIFQEHKEAVAQELGHSVDVSWFSMPPGDVPEDAREAVRQFEAALYQRLYEQLCADIERLRRVLGAVVERRERRALAWMRLSSNKEAVDVAKRLVNIPDNSTGRAIVAFMKKHELFDAAGVDPMIVGDVTAREDKFITTAERALYRVSKSDLTEEDKLAAVRQIVEDAATMPSAADVARKWLNGERQIPRDIIVLEDGTRLVTFICPDDDAFWTLDKATCKIAVVYGNSLAALVEWFMKGRK